MINTLKKILDSLDLTDKESAILLTLFQSGPLYAATIAKRTRLNRTTAYGLLKSLAGKGLVASTKKEGVMQYTAIAPKMLPGYIARKQHTLHESEELARKVIPQLELLNKQVVALPQIQFFEGIEGVKQAYEDTLENNKGMVVYDLTGTDALFNKMGKRWVDYYVKKRANLGIKCFDIAPDSEWSRISQKADTELLRITKLLPAEFSFNTEIDIYDNKLAIFSFSGDNPIAVIIEDAHIADTLKTLFDYIDRSIATKS